MYQEIYKNHYRNLVTLATKLIGNRQIAEDVVQEVIIKIFVNQTVIETNLIGYLRRGVINGIYNNKRKKSYELLELKDTISVFTSNNNQLDNMIISEDLKAALKSIDKLPPKCKEVFKSSRFEGLTAKQISEKLNISINTVENHITKANKKINK